MMAVVRGVGAAWVAIVVAFSGCDDAATLTREGAGPANVKPLWVPAPGTFPPDVFSLAGGARGHWAISDERTIDGRKIFMAGNPGPTTFFETSFGPAEPYFLRMYEQQPDGIYQVGDTRFGMYDHPVLLVPSTVRVGMRWTGSPFDQQRFTFEITERSETAFPGEGVAWYLEVTDKDRLNFESFTDVYQGTPFDMMFIEGSQMGPFAARPSFSGVTVDNAWPFTPAGDAADLTSLPSVTPTPLNHGEAIFATEETMTPTFVGLVRDPAKPGVAHFGIDGLGTSFENGGGGLPCQFDGAPAFACATLDPGSGALAMADCVSARGAIVDGQSRLLRINQDGWLRAHECSASQGCAFEDPFQMAGMFLRPDGTVGVFRAKTDGALLVASHPGTPDVLHGNVTLPDQMLVSTSVPADSRLWLSEQDATGWANFIYDAEGRLGTLHVTTAGVADVQTAFVDIGGVLGLTVDSAGRHLLRAQADGTIERLTWDIAGIHRTGFVQVKLPKKHALVGALEDGSRVVLVTLADFEGTDTQYVRDTGEKDNCIHPGMGNLYLWEAVHP